MDTWIFETNLQLQDWPDREDDDIELHDIERSERERKNIILKGLKHCLLSINIYLKYEEAWLLRWKLWVFLLSRGEW